MPRMLVTMFRIDVCGHHVTNGKSLRRLAAITSGLAWAIGGMRRDEVQSMLIVDKIPQAMFRIITKPVDLPDCLLQFVESNSRVESLNTLTAIVTSA